jgi:uncharacterized repeat protein (TIGR03803 family)
MKYSARIALSIGAAALFAGCGVPRQGQDMQPPVGAAGTMPQSRIRPASSSYKVLYAFDDVPNGSSPGGGLLDVGGTLYGTASGGGLKKCRARINGGCGTFFSITPKGAEKLLYTFTVASGAYPQSRLLDLQGTLYGTAYYGGPTGGGVVYSMSTTGSEAVLYSFRGTSDGTFPRARVISVNHTLYGTNTYGGGKHRDGGTVYSVTLSGVHTVLHGFTARFDGHDPYSGLVDVHGTLYGTTLYNGPSASCCGIVYSITLSGKETVLYRFAGGSDGAHPRGDLLNVNGTLYGTTVSGGTGCNSYGCGTVYTVTTSGTEKVLYKFQGGSDGANPAAGLIDVNGTLYGTTQAGGGPSCSCGTVFSISTSGAETVLHRFAGGSDGKDPMAPLVAEKGMLYGTTSAGGDGCKDSNGCGTIFALAP